MTSAVSLQNRWHSDLYVSPESRQLGQPVWALLGVGLVGGVSTSLTQAKLDIQNHSLTDQFRRLATIVQRECAHLSVIREIVLHPAYLQIIGMGPSVLPLIFTELETNPGHWFVALRAITHEDPVAPNNRGVVSEMANDWLNWASRKGLRW